MVAVNGFFTLPAILFLQDTVTTMIPWIMVMLSVVLCDLAAGLRKSHLLNVHISISMAFRETMGKMVVYVGFVLMVAMIDAASNHSFDIAKWGCLFVCALEGGSIISNILKPRGIDISLREVIKIIGKRFGKMTEEETEGVIKEENVEKLREIEQDRWKKRDKHQYGANIENSKENKNKE